MSKNPEKIKSKYQLDLLEEKRAFVVIALTEKLTLAGKLVAMNALAHYNSERGYSWPSVPVIASECGYARSSKRPINAGLDEIERVGAFKIKWAKGGEETHHCCPIMTWFRAEYELLRMSGKVANDNDYFADVRESAHVTDNQRAQQGHTQDYTPGAQSLDPRGLKPRPPELIAPTPGAQSPTKRTEEEDERKRTKGTDNPERSASGMSGVHSGGNVPAALNDPRFVPDDAQPAALNDNCHLDQVDQSPF